MIAIEYNEAGNTVIVITKYSKNHIPINRLREELDNGQRLGLAAQLLELNPDELVSILEEHQP